MRCLGFATFWFVPTLALAGTSALWLNLPLSVGQAGFGNVSLGSGDILRAWTNPAALGDLDAKGEVTINGGSLLGGNQTMLGFGGAWRISEHWTSGVLAMSTSDSFSEIDASGNQIGGSVGRRVSSIAIGAGWQPGALRTGVLLHGVSDELVGDSASAVAVDAGAVYMFDPFILSLAARNLGTPLRNPAGLSAAESLPSEVRGGVAFKVASWHFLIAAEGQQQIGGGTDYGAGIEWWPVSAFGVRTGLPAMASTPSEVTAGLSVKIDKLQVDYATATNPLGLTHRMSLGWSFGVAPEVVTAPTTAVAVVVAPISLPAAAMAADVKVNVAVADLAAQGVSGSDAAMVTDMIRSAMVKAGVFNVVEKQNMDKLLAEQAFQQTGCTSAECAIKLGKVLNVQRMIVGSFGKLLSRYVVNVRVVNVEDGKILFTDEAMGDNVDQLMSQTKAMAERVSKSTR